MDKLDYLIKYLVEENKEVNIEKIPEDLEDKKNLYRGLCNIRQPKEISEEYLKIENEYLSEEIKKQNVIDVKDIKTISEDSKIALWQGDMTLLKIDSVINPANSQGLGCFVPLHNCLDNQLNSKAGISLRLECNKVMKEKDYNLKTSEPIITSAYNLPSKFIIHTVGPIIEYKVTPIQEKQLADCYINCLKLAVENGIRTIAFPCISTGVFRFPKDLASKIAVNTVKKYLENHDDEFDKVVFSVFSDDDYEFYKRELMK